MHDFAKVCAVWWLQANTVERILRDRKFKRQAKQFNSILKLLESMWMHEFGEPYVNELVRLIDALEEDKVAATNVAAKGEALPFIAKGEPQ